MAPSRQPLVTPLLLMFHALVSLVNATPPPPAPDLPKLHIPFFFEDGPWRPSPSDVFDSGGIRRLGIVSFRNWDSPRNFWPDKHHFPGKFLEVSDAAVWITKVIQGYDSITLRHFCNILTREVCCAEGWRH